MAPKVAALLVGYLALSLAIAAAAIYFAMANGVPFWIAALAAFLLFGWLNGTMAYLGRARQMRERGEVPPPYLVYLLNPTGKPFSFRDKVAVPRFMRVLLGVVLLLGGVFLAFAGVVILFAVDLSTAPYPNAARVAMAILAAVGLAALYLSWRLVVVKDDEPLFKKRAPF
jgi:hypothetical protein